jgi:hypothetical protein
MTRPANAEGIASEGGLAQAANPRECRADAPWAEAEELEERLREEARRYEHDLRELAKT